MANRRKSVASSNQWRPHEAYPAAGAAARLDPQGKRETAATRRSCQRSWRGSESGRREEREVLQQVLLTVAHHTLHLGMVMMRARVHPDVPHDNRPHGLVRHGGSGSAAARTARHRVGHRSAEALRAAQGALLGSEPVSLFRRAECWRKRRKLVGKGRGYDDGCRAEAQQWRNEALYRW